MPEGKFEDINDQIVAQQLLEPFQQILNGWSVEVVYKFKRQISQLRLVATRDLEKNWHVKVRALVGNAIVADFAFPEYGRLFDMRRVEYRYPPPAKELEEWVKSKVDQGQIKFSTVANKRNLSFTHPDVIRDLSWRIARSEKFQLPIRRWYNKGKEANIRDLYGRLQKAMSRIVVAAAKGDLQLAPQRAPSNVLDVQTQIRDLLRSEGSLLS